MASNKLDQSLDEILSTQRQQRRTSGGPNRRGGPAGNAARRAPAGGIQKSAKLTRSAAKAGQGKSTFASGESKISVSNLPKDVSEAQIKDYFTQSVGPVKRVEISYGPGGASRGIASVVFQQADAASKAFNTLNGLLIDNRPVKVEVVISDVKLIPVVQPLGQRIQQVAKSQPKSAANDKSAKGPQPAARGRGGKRGGRGGRVSRPRKSEKELDEDMADYFDGSAAPAPEGTAGANPTTAATNGDATMEDEIV